ncbi:inovirus Gp2 family protein [Vibrio sp. Isolate23]|nr:inovirus Gp2 family protein [Vibrio sp. Isolate23]
MHLKSVASFINNYFMLLKEKIDTGSVFYVWRKREDKVPSHNYRVMLFTDYSKHFVLTICWDKRNELVEHLKEAWQEAIEEHYSGKERSLVLLDTPNFVQKGAISILASLF